MHILRPRCPLLASPSRRGFGAFTCPGARVAARGHLFRRPAPSSPEPPPLSLVRLPFRLGPVAPANSASVSASRGQVAALWVTARGAAGEGDPVLSCVFGAGGVDLCGSPWLRSSAAASFLAPHFSRGCPFSFFRDRDRRSGTESVQEGEPLPKWGTT